MLFLDTVEVLDPEGGPWGRGYLKAVTPISPDDWYFAGHFKNDPCMPGTLMLEGCVQAMAFYLSALGFGVDKDGWRFQPIEHETYSLRCRGQVTPTSQELTYEIFVEELHDGPEPLIYADLLCTVDGLGAFHARRFGLKLTPSWPLSSQPELLAASTCRRCSPARGGRRRPRSAPCTSASMACAAPHGCRARPTSSPRGSPRWEASWAAWRAAPPSSSNTTYPRTPGTSTRTARG